VYKEDHNAPTTESEVLIFSRLTLLIISAVQPESSLAFLKSRYIKLHLKSNTANMRFQILSVVTAALTISTASARLKPGSVLEVIDDITDLASDAIDVAQSIDEAGTLVQNGMVCFDLKRVGKVTTHPSPNLFVLRACSPFTIPTCLEDTLTKQAK
jgi:hypothetical protein